MTTSLRLILTALIALAGLCCTGCSTPGGVDASRPAQRTTSIEVVESRVDVVHGRTLVVPVMVGGSVPQAAVPVHLDDGRRVDAALHVITAEAQDRPSWLPGAGVWKAQRAGEAGTSPEGWWVLTIDLPHDALNQNISIAGSEVELNWFLDPSLAGLPSKAWSVPHPDAIESPQLLALAEPERHHPLRRWRWRLLTDGLAPEKDEDGAALDDPVLEALARQAEGRWQTALGMLWRADEALARRVRERLAAVVVFPEGNRAPAWPLQQSTLDALLSDLLRPGLSPRQRAGRARAWLEALPGGAAWVIDDSGLRDAGTGAPIATVGVANLGHRDVAFSAASAQGPAEMRRIPALGARTLAPLMPAGDAPRGGAGTHEVNLAGGRWSAGRSVVSDALVVSPPGLRMEPFHADWTLHGWLSGVPVAAMHPDRARATAALLHYSALEASPDGSRTRGGSTWRLHVECRAPAQEEGDDELVVWIGPLGSPSSVLRITRDGEASDLHAAGRGRSDTVRGAVVTSLPDRWVASIPIDAGLIDASGELLIGLVRIDSRGARSAWPRPMLPWQAEPGRVTVDTTSWGEIVRPTPVER